MQPRKIFVAAFPIITIVAIAIFFIDSPFAKGEPNYTETTTYLLTDHLGSIDVVMDDQGKVLERADYLPFGSDRLRVTSTTGPTTGYKFTGKELDDETGLMYYGARYYDPAIGRFISFDPLLLNEGSKPLSSVLQNPQALNPYSYVTNNPIIMVDETGEYQEDVHYDLTYFIGIMAGFSGNQAAEVAYYDQNVDDNPATSPYNPFATEKYHYATRSDALGRLDSALENKSLLEFGTALHTFQDTYSHAGLTPEDHATLSASGKSPDNTSLNSASIAKATTMARSTFFQLRKLNLQINGSGDLSKDDYIKQSTEIWNRFKTEINKNNSLSKEQKEKTKIGIMANNSKETNRK